MCWGYRIGSVEEEERAIKQLIQKGKGDFKLCKS